MPLPCPVALMPRSLVLFIFTACAAALLQPSLARAEQETQSSTARLKQVEKQIESHHQKIEESHIKALNLEQEMHRIDSQIAKAQENILDLKEKSNIKEAEIQNKEIEISRIVTEKNARAAHIKARLAGFYKSGEVGVINALFSATDLGDLLNLQEYVQALFQYDKQVSEEFRAQIALLAQAREELAQARADLQALISQAEEGEKALLDSRQERDLLLAQVRTELELNRQATQALQEVATKLTTAIEQKQARERKAARKNAARAKHVNPLSPTNTGFHSAQGKMTPPAIGPIIREFGPYIDPFGNKLRSDGIDIDVPPETPITAMYQGRVIFADNMPGYGNLIIIDHGSQYYTLISGLASLHKTKDDLVNAGDVIGIFGQFSGLINPGLHVEIRHGSTPIDPLPWFDPRQLEAVQ